VAQVADEAQVAGVFAGSFIDPGAARVDGYFDQVHPGKQDFVYVVGVLPLAVGDNGEVFGEGGQLGEHFRAFGMQHGFAATDAHTVDLGGAEIFQKAAEHLVAHHGAGVGEKRIVAVHAGKVAGVGEIHREQGRFGRIGQAERVFESDQFAQGHTLLQHMAVQAQIIAPVGSNPGKVLKFI